MFKEGWISQLCQAGTTRRRQHRLPPLHWGRCTAPLAPAHLLDGLDTFPCSLSLLSSLGLPLPVTALCMLSPVPRAARWASANSFGLCLLSARAAFQPRTVRAMAEGWTFCKAEVSPCLPAHQRWLGRAAGQGELSCTCRGKFGAADDDRWPDHTSKHHRYLPLDLSGSFTRWKKKQQFPSGNDVTSGRSGEMTSNHCRDP